MFVAYTGYGRIATMGEQVRDPYRTIPRAIIITLGVIMALYIAVAFVGIGSVGAEAIQKATQERAAPFETVARSFAVPGAGVILSVGAVTAMLGVLLNLILGLSRVLLAMGRKGDMPRVFGKLDPTGTTPTAAVIMMGIVIAGLALIGNVRITWSFSAFTVLIYYAITNLAALYIPDEGRLFPKWVAVAGLVSCLLLAFFVEPLVWLTGFGLVVLGLVWFWLVKRFKHANS